MHSMWQVRRKYLELVKLHHPDTRNFTKKSEMSDDEFARIDAAYKGLLPKFKEDEAKEKAMEGEYGLYYDEAKMPETEEGDTGHKGINHVIPQHRWGVCLTIS